LESVGGPETKAVAKHGQVKDVFELVFWRRTIPLGRGFGGLEGITTESKDFGNTLPCAPGDVVAFAKYIVEPYEGRLVLGVGRSSLSGGGSRSVMAKQSMAIEGFLPCFAELRVHSVVSGVDGGSSGGGIAGGIVGVCTKK
jgi:hypothetical protein